MSQQDQREPEPGTVAECEYCGGPLSAEDVAKGYAHCSEECFDADTASDDFDDEEDEDDDSEEGVDTDDEEDDDEPRA